MISYCAEFNDEGTSEVAGMASPGDLAVPVAQALKMFDRQGKPRARFEAWADEGGRRRALTNAEQQEFEAALTQALDELDAGEIH